VRELSKKIRTISKLKTMLDSSEMSDIEGMMNIVSGNLESDENELGVLSRDVHEYLGALS